MSGIIAGRLTKGGAENLARNLNHLCPAAEAHTLQPFPGATEWQVAAQTTAPGVCAAVWNELGHHVLDHGRKIKANESCGKMQRCNGTGQIQVAVRGESKMRLVPCSGCDECEDEEESDDEEEEI